MFHVPCSRDIELPKYGHLWFDNVLLMPSWTYDGVLLMYRFNFQHAILFLVF